MRYYEDFAFNRDFMGKIADSLDDSFLCLGDSFETRLATVLAYSNYGKVGRDILEIVAKHFYKKSHMVSNMLQIEFDTCDDAC